MVSVLWGYGEDSANSTAFSRLIWSYAKQSFPNFFLLVYFKNSLWLSLILLGAAFILNFKTEEHSSHSCLVLWLDKLHFYFQLKVFKNFPEDFLTQMSFRGMFFNFQIFRNCPSSFLLLTFSSVHLWSANILSIISSL